MLLLVLLPLFGICQKVDTISRSEIDHGGMGVSFKYTLSCDNVYTSSLYLNKAGNSLIGGGVFLGLSLAAAIAPNFLPDASKTATTYLICGAASGVFLIGSVVYFCIAGDRFKEAGIILRSGKNYTIQTDGTSFRVIF